VKFVVNFVEILGTEALCPSPFLQCEKAGVNSSHSEKIFEFVEWV
jgi:hypothetical protein